jgi:hypothetical protein
LAGANAKTLCNAGAKTFEYRIGLFSKAQQRRDTIGGLQVERDTAFATVEIIELGITDKEASTGAFYPDDIRAHVRQQHAGKRTRPNAGYFDDRNSREWTHCVFLITVVMNIAIRELSPTCTATGN